jgi:hypothetical protein
MDAPEHLWVQTRLQLVQRSIVGRPRHLPCNYVNRLIGQRRIDDLFGLHQQESFADLDSHLISSSARHHLYEPLELIVDRVRTFLAQPSAGTTQCLFQAGTVDRLQEVVDRIHLERLHGVLIEGCDEDERKCVILTFEKVPCDLEPVQSGHLDIEKDQIGREAINRSQRLDAVAGLRDDVYITELLELVTQLVARRLLVVNHQYS